MRLHETVVKTDFVCFSSLYSRVQKLRMKICYETAFGMFALLHQLKIVLDYNY